MFRVDAMFLSRFSMRAMIAVAVMAILIAMPVSADALGEVAPLASDPVIYIDGDIDLASRGFNGSGTEGDPWVIENLDIDAQSGGYAIYMANIEDHFVIRNCTLYGARVVEPDYEGAGIEFFNVTNGVVYNNTIQNCDVGIWIRWYCNGNIFHDNTITWNNDRGILVQTEFGNVLTNNTISYNRGQGILVQTGWYTTIANNTISHNSDSGIEVSWDLENSVVSNNDISENLNGIEMSYSDGNIIDNNTLFDNSLIGMSFKSSTSNVVDNNTISEHGSYGIIIDSVSFDNLLYHNSLVGNTVDARDEGNNAWNLSYPQGGNHWDSYNATDLYSGASQDTEGQDGIADAPYSIEGGSNVDGYPLMASWNGTLSDDVAPTVVGTDPSDGDVDVNVDDALSITFSEFMDQGTVTYTLDGLGNCTLIWEDDSPSAHIDHDRMGYNQTYMLNITGGQDLAGNPLSNVPFSIGFTTAEDTIPPYVTMVSPINGTFTGVTEYNVVWTGGDDGRGLDHYEIRVNGGEWIDVGTNTSYDLSTISEGTYTIEVMAFDLVGNNASDSVVLIVDHTPPSVALTYPTEGACTNVMTVTFTWEGGDALSGLDHYELRVNGAVWMDMGTDTSWSYVFPEGDFLVELRAYDAVGNMNETSANFSVDRTSPIVTMTSPSDGDGINTSAVTIAWTGYDTGVGIDHYEISVSGISGWIDVGNVTEYVIELSQGDHQITVAAYDLAGNGNSAPSVTVTVDSIVPYLQMINMQNDTAYGSGDVTMTWYGSDLGTGLDRFEIMLDDGGWLDVGVEMTYELVDVQEGEHVFHVRAYDELDNMNTTSIWFWVDFTNPWITITLPEEGGYVNVGRVNFTWDGGDDESGIDHYEINLFGTGWLNAGTGAYFTSGVGLNDGWHTVPMRAVDRAGNMAYDNVTFLLDSTTPYFTGFDMESENGIWNDTEMLISWTADDSSIYYDTSGIGHYGIAINGGELIDIGMDTSYLLTGLTDGYWEVTVVVYDNASNSLNYTAAFTVDMTPPEVWFTAPSNMTVVKAWEDLVFNWTAEDDGTGVDHYVLYDEYDTDGSQRGSETSISITVHGDGEHTITIRAYDQAGNYATTSITYVVDGTAPQIVERSPTGDAVPVDCSIEVTFSEGMNASATVMSVDRLGTAVPGTLSWDGLKLTFTPEDALDEGATFTVAVQGEDLVGNIIDDGWTFTTYADDGSWSLSGQVVDEDGDPIAGAVVIVDGTQVGTTDSEGRFNVTVQSGDHTLSITKEGYDDREVSVSADDGGEVGTLELMSDDGDEVAGSSVIPYVAAIVVAIVVIFGIVIYIRRR